MGRGEKKGKRNLSPCKEACWNVRSALAERCYRKVSWLDWTCFLEGKKAFPPVNRGATAFVSGRPDLRRVVFGRGRRGRRGGGGVMNVLGGPRPALLCCPCCLSRAGPIWATVCRPFGWASGLFGMKKPGPSHKHTYRHTGLLFQRAGAGSLQRIRTNSGLVT